jgi:hypothetical protein
MVHLLAVATSTPVGGYHSWQYLLIALAISLVFLLSSREDRNLGVGIGEFLSLFIALFALAAMLVKALTSAWWTEAFATSAALCVEIWLIKRWKSKQSPH